MQEPTAENKDLVGFLIFSTNKFVQRFMMRKKLLTKKLKKDKIEANTHSVSAIND